MLAGRTIRLQRFPAMTLMEIMVATAIGMIIVTLLVMISVDGRNTFEQINSRQNRNSAFLETFDEVFKQVRSAVEFPTTYGSYTADAHTLIMKQYSIATDNGQVDTTHYDYIIFIMGSDMSLRYIIQPDSSSKRPPSDRILFTDIQTLTFTQVKSGNEHRQVTMTLIATMPKSYPSLTRTQTMVARND